MSDTIETPVAAMRLVDVEIVITQTLSCSRTVEMMAPADLEGDALKTWVEETVGRVWTEEDESVHTNGLMTEDTWIDIRCMDPDEVDGSDITCGIQPTTEG